MERNKGASRFNKSQMLPVPTVFEFSLNIIIWMIWHSTYYCRLYIIKYQYKTSREGTFEQEGKFSCPCSELPWGRVVLTLERVIVGASCLCFGASCGCELSWGRFVLALEQVVLSAICFDLGASCLWAIFLDLGVSCLWWFVLILKRVVFWLFALTLSKLSSGDLSWPWSELCGAQHSPF